MIIPGEGYLEFAPDCRICRIINGMWQVSGGHGRIDPDMAVTQMLAYHDAGFTTWDLADHYGPAEDFIGQFRVRLSERRGPEALQKVVAFTKWVPRPGPVSRDQVTQALDSACRRMGVKRLDMLQFHWWDYADQGFLDALKWLAEFRAQGRIANLGLTNFDSEHLQQILEAGIPIASNQVQYSLIDRRPESRMAALCSQYGVRLLTYGTLMGGLLSDKYLGAPEPEESRLNTLSLRKYKETLDRWGSWHTFQELLAALRAVADRLGVSLANVAVRALLDRPQVAAVIVGTRLGVSEHIAETAQVFRMQLTPEDNEAIAAVVGRGQDLFELMGDCGSEYRTQSTRS